MKLYINSTSKVAQSTSILNS